MVMLKKSGLISLRGTLVPAKTLNNLISKIPVVGDILIGKKVGRVYLVLVLKLKDCQTISKQL